MTQIKSDTLFQGKSFISNKWFNQLNAPVE